MGAPDASLSRLANHLLDPRHLSTQMPSARLPAFLLQPLNDSAKRHAALVAPLSRRFASLDPEE